MKAFQKLLLLTAPLLAIGTTLICPNNNNVKPQVKSAYIGGDGEESIFQVHDDLVKGRASMVYQTSRYNINVAFNNNSTLRYAYFDLIITPVVNYDYEIFIGDNLETYIFIKNYELSFSYITRFLSLGDSGPAISDLINNREFSLNIGIGKVEENFIILLNNYDKESNLLPTSLFGLNSVDYTFNKSTNGYIKYDTSFQYYANYVNKDTQAPCSFKSELFFPYEYSTNYNTGVSSIALPLNNIFGNNYDVASCYMSNMSDLESYNINALPLGSLVPYYYITNFDTIYNLGYKTGNSYFYGLGYDAGVNDTLSKYGSDGGVFSVIGSAFNSVTNFLSIKVFGSLTLGTLLLIPITFGVLMTIIKMIGS